MDSVARPSLPVSTNKMSTRETIRKSERLGLSFPYDWSNPEIRDEALILNVLERGIFEDLCRICAHFGVQEVERQADRIRSMGKGYPSLERMLNNIKIGFENAQN